MPEIYELVAERHKVGNRPLDIIKELKYMKANGNTRQINHYKRYGSGQPKFRGGKRSVCTPEMIKSNQNNPQPTTPTGTSGRWPGRIDPKTVRKIMHEDLGMKSYSITD